MHLTPDIDIGGNLGMGWYAFSIIVLSNFSLLINLLDIITSKGDLFNNEGSIDGTRRAYPRIR